MNLNKKKQIVDLKNDLINYYDTIKFDIDIKSQQLMQQSFLDNLNNQDEILKLNLSLIKRVETLFEQNIKEINDYDLINEDEYADIDIEYLKKLLFKNYCTFIKSDSFKKESNELNDTTNIDIRKYSQIGLLIETDWYLSENQINYLKIKFEDRTELAKKSIQFNLDENVLNLMYAFKEKLFRLNKDYIALSKNEIENQLSNLTKLNLALNQDEKNLIKKIENNSFITLSNLKELSLCDNISSTNTLHAGEHLFNGLNNLKVFNLNLTTNLVFMTDITTNNSWLNLSYLKELNLSNIELIVLNQSTFKELVYLERLFLIDCSINFIEANSFEKMKNLEYLNLSHNRLSKLNRQIFNGLKKLNRLVLTWSSIREIDDFVFENLNMLVKLDLSYNKLNKCLNENTFFGLINLKHLYLSNYSMRLLDANTFKMLKSLRTLDLSNHKIEILKSQCFIGLSNLIELNLSTGRIQIIESNTMNSLKKLRYLYIYENPFEIKDKYLFQNEHNLKSLERINFKKLLPIYKKKRHIFVLKCELAMLLYYLIVFFIRLFFYSN